MSAWNEAEKACDYKLSKTEAEALKGASLLPAEFRVEILKRYAAEHGDAAVIHLFAQFIGMANSVVANNREMAEIILITEGGLWPQTAEKANLPTIFGALSGVTLAESVPQKRLCGGCAFRHGTCANQSPVTTLDVDWCEGDERFMCHEELKDGEPTRVCRGFALRKRSAGRSALAQADRGTGDA